MASTQLDWDLRYRELLEQLGGMSPRPVALEALWDGDTQGWFVDLFAVTRSAASYESRYLQTFSGGGDIRVFNGQVPPWPEAQLAAKIGQQLADALGIPFHFPSPSEPEDDCPHWWQLGESSPCTRCSIPLLQKAELPWRGVCYRCHLALETEAREAKWTPEERAARRCHLCGLPVLGATEAFPECASCRDKYRTTRCANCGTEARVHRDKAERSVCSSCLRRLQLSALSASDLERLHRATEIGMIEALIEIRAVLGCTLVEAQEALHVLQIDRNQR